MTWLTVCLLVFSQLAVSAYACASLSDELANASSATAMNKPIEGMPGCEMSTVHHHSVLCKAHCQRDEQSADNNVPTVHPPLLMVLFFTAPFADPTQPLVSALSVAPSAVASSPPLRIQYQVFRI